MKNIVICYLFFSFLRKLICNGIQSCSEVVDFSDNLCLSCSEGYYSYWDQKLPTSPFPAEDCLPKLNDQLEMEVFVSDKTCADYSPCDGSPDNPFDNFIYALDLINNKTRIYSNPVVRIFMLGKETFILEQDLNSAVKYYFRRSAITLEISALPCNIRLIPGCQNGEEKFIINFKTNQFVLFIGVFFRLKNIVINGIDMPLEMISSPPCYSERRVCCGIENKVFLNDCPKGLAKKNVFINTSSVYGLFHADAFAPGNNSFGYRSPQISIENCDFINVFTFFPTKGPRFSCLLKIISDNLSLSLRNVIISNCSLANGVFNHIVESTNNINSGLVPANISIVNVSVSYYKKNDNLNASNKIISVQNIRGHINISKLSLIHTKSSSQIILLSFKNVNFSTELNDVFLGDNEDVQFLSCKFCRVLKLNEILLTNSSINLIEGNSLIDVRDSEEFVLNKILVKDFSFIYKKEIIYAMTISNINGYTELYNIFIERVISLALAFQSTIIRWRTFVVLDFSTEFTVIKTHNCSTVLERMLLSYININFEILFLIESLRAGGSHYFLKISDSHFSNILFFKYNLDRVNAVFRWPISTSTDLVNMRNISVFNCTHEIIKQYTIFILALVFNKIELQDIEYSYNSRGRNNFIYIVDTSDVILINGSFKHNYNMELFLLHIFYWYCPECHVYVANIKIEYASFNYICIYFAGGNGIFENFTFENIIFIMPSNADEYALTYFTGLIIFDGLESCFIRKWTFESSENYEFSPSHLFHSSFNKNISFENIYLHIVEHTTNFAQVHILISTFDITISVQGLWAQSFYCQNSYQGNFLYESGLVSFINSGNFLEDSNFNGSVTLNNIFIENCKFCKNGVVGLININFVLLKNLHFTYSKNLNGGAIAVFYGLKVTIENIKVSNSTAFQKGGAIYLVGCHSVNLRNSSIFLSDAKNGGALYLNGISLLSIYNFSCVKCKAFEDGGAIYSINSNFIIQSGLVYEYQSRLNGGCIYARKGTLKIKDKFESFNGSAQRGGFLFAYEVVNVTLADVKVRDSSSSEKGVSFFFEECSEFYFENISLINIKSESGYGNIYVQIRSKSASYIMKNIICHRINMVSSMLILLENELSFPKTLSVTLHEILVLESFGSVVFIKCANLNENHTFLLDTLSVSQFYSTQEIVDKENLNNFFMFYSTFLTIKNIILKELGLITDCFLVSESTVILESIYFQARADNYDNYKESITIYFIYSINSRVFANGISFYGAKAMNLGYIIAEISQMTLKNGFLLECQTQKSSCIDLYDTKAELSFYSFIENRGYAAGVINSKYSSLTVISSDFLNNTVIDFNKLVTLNLIARTIGLFETKSNETSAFEFCKFVEAFNTSSILIHSSIIKITSSSFKVIAVKDKACSLQIKALHGISSDIEIISSNFSNFVSINGGTFRVEHAGSSYIRNFTLKYSRIANSSSDYGGAFSLVGFLNVFVLDNLFMNNQVFKNNFGLFGNFGVGLFLCSICEKTQMNLTNNNFLSNLAENSIATVFSNAKIYTGQQTDYDTNVYSNNSDGNNFSGNITSFPLKTIFFTRILTEDSYQNIELDKSKFLEFRSGQCFDFGFILLDDLGQQFSLIHHSKALLYSPFKENISLLMIANKNALSEKGEFLFTNLLINSELNKSLPLQILINFNLEFLYSEHREFLRQLPISMNVFSKPCEIGDIIIEGDLSCVKCPPGKYSIIDPMKDYYSLKFNQRCLACPNNAYCPGGSAIIPLTGFWRYSNSSSLIVECLSKSSCLGVDDGKLSPEEAIHGRCMKYSFGPLCYKCEKGYARLSKTGECKICSSTIDSYVKLAIVIFIFVVYSLIQIKITFQAGGTSTAGILLKIIVTHFQQIHLITLVDLGWTRELKALILFQEALAFVSEDFIPLDCLFENMSDNVYIQKVIFTNIYPIVLSMLIPAFWVVSIILSSAKGIFTKIKFLKIIQVTFLIIIVLIFPEVINKCLSLLTCLSVEDSSHTKLLLYSPEVICWSDNHKRYLVYAVIPGLIVWGVLAPLVLAFFLFRNKKMIKRIIEAGSLLSKTKEGTLTLSSSNFIKQKGIYTKERDKAILLKFLYKGYSSNYFYWELFIFFKKFLLISIGCISDLFPARLRGVALLVLIAFFLFIQMRCNPFECASLNKLEFLSLLTTFLTADIGILIFSRDFMRFALPLIMCVLFIHFVFFAFWLYLFVIELHNTFIKSNKQRNKPSVSTLRNEKDIDFDTILAVAEESSCNPVSEHQPRKIVTEYMGSETQRFSITRQVQLIKMEN